MSKGQRSRSLRTKM